VLRQLPRFDSPSLLVGYDTSDDAAVWRLGDGRVMVQTVDFFTPVVDDPYDFGRIAAANALSDVYAMGAEPALALNIVGYPMAELGAEVLGEILRGGADKVREAGAVIAGGHSIDDKEPKYGLVVTGFAREEEVRTNAGARAGDVLVLTKPLGSGILATAIKRGLLDEAATRGVVEVMAALNRAGAAAVREVPVDALTDVTGFGLLGHLLEMLRASGAAARLDAAAVPLLEGVVELAGRDVFPGGSAANLAWVEEAVAWDERVAVGVRRALADAQTSGGLLCAVPAERVGALVEALGRHGALCAAVIGEVVEHDGGAVRVRVRGQRRLRRE
jgi:selenide,water dikinase